MIPNADRKAIFRVAKLELHADPVKEIVERVERCINFDREVGAGIVDDGRSSARPEVGVEIVGSGR